MFAAHVLARLFKRILSFRSYPAHERFSPTWSDIEYACPDRVSVIRKLLHGQFNAHFPHVSPTLSRSGYSKEVPASRSKCVTGKRARETYDERAGLRQRTCSRSPFDCPSVKPNGYVHDRLNEFSKAIICIRRMTVNSETLSLSKTLFTHIRIMILIVYV